MSLVSPVTSLYHCDVTLLKWLSPPGGIIPSVSDKRRAPLLITMCVCWPVSGEVQLVCTASLVSRPLTEPHSIPAEFALSAGLPPPSSDRVYPSARLPPPSSDRSPRCAARSLSFPKRPLGVVVGVPVWTVKSAERKDCGGAPSAGRRSVTGSPRWRINQRETEERNHRKPRRRKRRGN